MLDYHDLNIGDWISFEENPRVLFLVVDIRKNGQYFKYYDNCYCQYLWERFEYIALILHKNYFK